MHGWKRGEKMNLELGDIQTKFMGLVWDREPVGSGELVKVSAEELGWKKSTTYTVIKKLCDKGILKNEDGIVTTLISREKFFAKKSRQFVEESFNGSLPAFIAAFCSGKKLTQKEADEIQKMIDSYVGEKK